MPIGYLATVILMALCTFFALAPPQPSHSSPSNLSFWFGYLLNELPFLAFWWLLASTLLAFGQGDIGSPGSWATVGLAVLTTAGLGVIAKRELQAKPVIDQALNEGLGPGWRKAINDGVVTRLRNRPPYGRILFAPFYVRRQDVERITDISYGDKDTIVIAKDARDFVDNLRIASSNPVVYAGLPGAQHSFDLFHSLRFDTVVDGIEAFAAWVRAREEASFHSKT